MAARARAGVAAIIPTFNEEVRIASLAPLVLAEVERVIVIADGCTDGTAEAARKAGANVVERAVRGGPGPAIRDGLRAAADLGCHVVVVMAANGKHSPDEIARLVDPILAGDYDLVRGSRNLAGGSQENMPQPRLFLTHVFTWLFSLLLGQRVTDATGGFQAYKLSLIDDPRIDIGQRWLNGRYELETYLFAKMLKLGYRWCEVPVTISYPASKRNYTRARPLIDWWSYFRPAVLVGLGLKR